MNFIKTHIYEQEYTNEGIKEHEKDARSAKEIDENNRLKELPEFKRDNQFLSLSEQLELKKNNNSGAGGPGKEDEAGLANIYDMPNMTEEYAEYYDNYAKHDNYSIQKIREREKEVEFEFKEALKSYAKKKELKEKEDEADLWKEEESNHLNLREIKKNMIKKKKKIIPVNKTSVKAIIKTKKKSAIASPKEGHTDVRKASTRENNSLLLGYSDYSDE
ncbi:hypothetical protein AK88_02576 [Plasmodium fragile]|uniref:Uncharacterized protein n=1 Tax=Plasmodium fragile TaxID=5857 RepID=A0A0D9QL85_PLAFR|nr:uncharacterized protein AK88_02576 [Plasmodium fragile]KJP87820.1 hypothetical protein AK88_02576 [Plasmodium fragile]